MNLLGNRFDNLLSDIYYSDAITLTPGTWTVMPEFDTNFLLSYKLVTLCTVITNNTGRNVVFGSIPIAALFAHGHMFEVPFDTDGQLGAGMKYNYQDGCLSLYTGSSGWYVRLIFSR